MKGIKTSGTKEGTRGELPGPFGYLREWVSRTPAAAFVAVVATMLVAESLGAWKLVKWLPALEPFEPLVEVAIALGIVLPVLMLLFVLPTAESIRRREATERALREAHAQLEAKVRERTAELEESNRRLRESEDKYSMLVESSPTGIFIHENECLAFVNRRFAQLLECSADELLGAELWHFVHPDDRERVAEIAGKRLAGGPVPEECECRLVTKAGQVRWVSTRSTLIRHRGGVATLSNVQDVTEHRRLETELRQLSARLLTIQEEERRRVARDLHDSVGQKLTGIKFMVEAALGAPWPGERRSGIEKLRSLVPTIQDAVEEVRRIAMDLRPSSLDDLGLLPTIDWYVREFEKAHPHLRVEQRIQASESDVPRRLRVPIYRIVQEATTNAAKHSGASHLVLEIQAADGRLRLRVQDDGVGFDTTRPCPRPGESGSGLSSMRERAELSEGTYFLASSTGGGTSIEAAWALDAPTSA